MDRLICGDVGFGKTEVALRAIFCVVSAGKQAMVLAPTIVLAKQHFDVITERFSKYPNIKVGLLSRFQTTAEKEKHLRMIKHGDLDIIVGTHSLLGNRVVYSNLGLLVVDEEQRFGVKQKEKIASFKTSVDVLTLSATPIPRTLYLALTGFRDASLISTPPPERVPIITHLSAYNKEKIISAIKFELGRGGQVFYVLPRIKGLEEVMEFLECSFPDVEIAIAHGKGAIPYRLMPFLFLFCFTMVPLKVASLFDEKVKQMKEPAIRVLKETVISIQFHVILVHCCYHPDD
ncbi:ATP-dependent DNA helicase, chloroplastic [Vitis vinifera]|uniref:ATP-dependent DNA helicase, chloroplastic n=1 Tax=Vitis vinifera TaxID=29760 RepID=A0A438EC44_VITVI|nr:ATP-dependent DNA helicase, chloroplastic [Vitis vinifera]